MAEKQINPWLKLALELGPVLVFFIGFGRMKDQTFTIFGNDYSGFLVMTALFIPLLLLTTGIVWALTGKLSKMQVATVVLVVVFGGLSVWLKDERFFKAKPTLIYLLFGGILGFGLLRGKSYLRLVMDEALPMQAEGWMILTRRITAFFFGLAVANEVIWRNFSTEAWVNFKTFGLTAALFLFFMTQGRLMQKYGIEKDDEAA
ncbi:inner membrane-spanning protein YciB [Rhodobacter ferrooxidans]|uniref:Inner membrane-spanning protein YciB n=1 Tax=Rhodobacter ferrooxidans TaxID=371731 RepID=C8S4L6_9RHOB|nr:inner membrane-spanning protein YciB [Rhodobacter sp. SW2]EEW24099.1 Intracellular septation protein A [Rhodobacter sp. SW2]